MIALEARREARTEYRPQAKAREWLNAAMAHIQSVDYAVSARWVCYRLLQDGVIPSKAAFSTLDGYMSRARKANWNGWTPFTLADSVRETIRESWPGSGDPDSYDPEDMAFERMTEIDERFLPNVSRWWYEDHYVEVWYEARAMTEQFKRYVPADVALQPCGGDVSIPMKAAGARRLLRWSRSIGKPPVILYFGDLDPKGEMIPQSAATELLAWCPGLTIYRVGLLQDHVDQYDLIDSPDNPGKYQWEALTDRQAAELIGGAVEDFVTDEAERAAEERADEIANEAMDHFRQMIVDRFGEST